MAAITTVAEGSTLADKGNGLWSCAHFFVYHTRKNLMIEHACSRQYEQGSREPSHVSPCVNARAAHDHVRLVCVPPAPMAECSSCLHSVNAIMPGYALSVLSMEAL